MAERSLRRAALRVSRSPSPVAEPCFRPKPQMQTGLYLGPLGMSWPAYRWTVRALLVLCLFLCAVMYVFSHSVAEAAAKTRVMEALAGGFGVLVCMSKTWHRKRLPGYLIWISLLLLLYLAVGASGARNMYRDDLIQRQELEKKTLQDQQQSHETLQTMRTLQAQLAQKEKEQQETLRTVRTLQSQLERMEEEERAKRVLASAVEFAAWSLLLLLGLAS